MRKILLMLSLVLCGHSGLMYADDDDGIKTSKQSLQVLEDEDMAKLYGHLTDGLSELAEQIEEFAGSKAKFDSEDVYDSIGASLGWTQQLLGLSQPQNLHLAFSQQMSAQARLQGRIDILGNRLTKLGGAAPAVELPKRSPKREARVSADTAQLRETVHEALRVAEENADSGKAFDSKDVYGAIGTCVRSIGQLAALTKPLEKLRGNLKLEMKIVKQWHQITRLANRLSRLEGKPLAKVVRDAPPKDVAADPNLVALSQELAVAAADAEVDSESDVKFDAADVYGVIARNLTYILELIDHIKPVELERVYSKVSTTIRIQQRQIDGIIAGIAAREGKPPISAHIVKKVPAKRGTRKLSSGARH